MNDNFIGKPKDIIQRVSALEEDGVYHVLIRDFKADKVRSTNQNALYWSLLGQFAQWSKVSQVKLHNQMLMHYGQRELNAEGDVIDFYSKVEIDWENATEFHLYPLGEDAGLYVYRLLRGSRHYNTTEFSLLITGLMQEIEGCDAWQVINTLTFQERDLIAQYKRTAQYEKQKGKYYSDNIG